MKERPILFSGEMVRAILEGRKTQTRRVIKPQPKIVNGCDGQYLDWKTLLFKTRQTQEYMTTRCRYGLVGDRLWVKESWFPNYFLDEMDNQVPAYKANWEQLTKNTNLMEPKWRISIFMPRWASRILLEITGIRVERVAEISTADAIAEGIQPKDGYHPILQYAALWDQINHKRGYGWDVNPWVWVVESEVVK